jgi:uncharacterized membrane protein
MNTTLKFFHLAAAIFWMGGMAQMLLAVRPSALALMQPPERITFLAAVMGRFFKWVWASIAVLLATGVWALVDVGMKNAPAGYHAMLGIGLLMFAIFGHLYFVPFKRLQRAVVAKDWPLGGKQLAQIHPLVVTNFALSWLAVACVLVLR